MIVNNLLCNKNAFSGKVVPNPTIYILNRWARNSAPSTCLYKPKSSMPMPLDIQHISLIGSRGPCSRYLMTLSPKRMANVSSPCRNISIKIYSEIIRVIEFKI